MPSTGCGRAVSLCLSLCLFTADAGFELEVSPGRVVWARQGEPLTLSCWDSGCLDTSSGLFWSISGDNILGGKVTGGTSETQLTFDNVTADHYNTYRCKGSCGLKNLESKVQVRVYDASITLSLEPAVPVWAGKPVSVICHVDASVPVKVLRVQWFAGTELLETISVDSLTDTELSIDLTHQLTPQIQHQGQELSCVAHLGLIEGTAKEIKSESRNHSLNVLYGPLITLNRAAVFTATKGQNVTVTCSAPSNPPASISWSKLGPQDQLPISTQQATLKLYDVGFSDSGTYRCEASNGIQQDTKELQIQIEGAPSGTRLSITPSVAKQGENVTITCTTSSYPLAQFVLRRSGGGLPKLPSSNGTFTIISVQSANSGQYECEATNSLGMDTASEKLSLQDDPLIIILNRAAVFTATKGQNVTVTCSAPSNPPASISWSKLGSQDWLPISAQEATLKLYDVGFSDSGTYRCEASNGIQQDTKELQIQIEGAPSGTRLSITPSVAKQGENVTITCTTSSYPLAQFVLRRSGGGLPKLPSSNGTFTIISVQSANSGQYECEATNSLGMDTASEQLSVQDDTQSTTFARGTASTITTVPPQYLVVVVSPSRTFHKGQNLTFSCMANSSSPALYTWTKQGNETLLSSSNTFTILSAMDHHAGVYQVTVSNELGSKTGTAEIMITGERKVKDPGSPLVYLAVGGVLLGGLLSGLLWYRKMNLSKSFNLVPDQIL